MRLSHWILGSVLFIILGCRSAQLSQAYLDSYQAYINKHQKELTTGERAPLTANDLSKVRYFDPSKKAIVQAQLEKSHDEEPFDMMTYSGQSKSYRKYGILHFEYGGKASSLALYQSMMAMRMPQYRDQLFLPFKDDTNGVETYGGGRYIVMKMSDIKEGRVLIDFNKAYNPWCAYSDGYNCPIPPAENHLPYPIEAGELNYEK